MGEVLIHKNYFMEKPMTLSKNAIASVLMTGSSFQRKEAKNLVKCFFFFISNLTLIILELK